MPAFTEKNVSLYLLSIASLTLSSSCESDINNALKSIKPVPESSQTTEFSKLEEVHHLLHEINKATSGWENMTPKLEQLQVLEWGQKLAQMRNYFKSTELKFSTVEVMRALDMVSSRYQDVREFITQPDTNLDERTIAHLNAATSEASNLLMQYE